VPVRPGTAARRAALPFQPVGEYSVEPETGPENPIRILAARNALFEVDLDLGRWERTDSAALNGFNDALIRALPTLREHKCMPGEHGGFVSQLREGTHLAHVIEHVLLELLHLADPKGRTYTGWTNPKRDAGEEPVPGVYTIHFQVTSTEQGALAARCGVELVESLLAGRGAHVAAHLARLKESFACDEEPR
jgi:cyanophycin synthetase